MKLHVVTLLLILLMASVVGAEDIGSPSKVNNLFSAFDTPQLEPGQSGTFSFRLANPYSFTMTSVELNASIYRYATVEESRPLDPSWTWCEPFIKEAAQPCSKEYRLSIPELLPGNNVTLSFTVVTSSDMPHGTAFSESAFFVRFWLRFDVDQGSGPVRYLMASRGYFSDEQWRKATAYNSTNPCTDPACRGNINLGILGVDGIIPDSSFGVREPIPLWPFYLLVVLAVFFLILALFFYAEENPGTLPRIETFWLALKGRMIQFYRLRIRGRRTGPG